MGQTIKQEIERKFLVNDLLMDILSYSKYEIEQSYLSEPNEKNSIRVRRYSDGRCYMEIKGPGQKSRKEIGFKLTLEEYLDLRTENAVVKSRFKVPSVTAPGMIVFVDIFGGNLMGLKLAEVEVLSKKDEHIIDNYVPDAFLGREVTYDKRYSNRRLAFSQKRPSENKFIMLRKMGL